MHSSLHRAAIRERTTTPVASLLAHVLMPNFVAVPQAPTRLALPPGQPFVDGRTSYVQSRSGDHSFKPHPDVPIIAAARCCSLCSQAIIQPQRCHGQSKMNVNYGCSRSELLLCMCICVHTQCTLPACYIFNFMTACARGPQTVTSMHVR